MGSHDSATHARAAGAQAIAPHGYLHVGGAFAAGHAGEVEQVLRGEEARARALSPPSRIIAVDSDGGTGLLVSTATEHLAHRLGRALITSFGGELHHGFGHGSRLAFVWWRH